MLLPREQTSKIAQLERLLIQGGMGALYRPAVLSFVYEMVCSSYATGLSVAHLQENDDASLPSGPAASHADAVAGTE